MSNRSRAIHTFLPIVFSLFLFLAFPGRAAATQVHPAEEGVYVHQLGHFFFIISMGILIYWLRRRGLTRESGWRFIQYSAFFFILWNLDAVIVHYLEDVRDVFEVQGSGQWNLWVHEVYGHSTLSLLYYICRMDHLLCVPAVILFYIGLSHLLKHTGTNGLPERRS